ncbi:unnamed protein product [Lupinus luteus]|uniref:Tubulin/FtsZ 2-layer sandwich domain-containing protein n=1 Tax=Lupinus luteus TaxID=3873 RepID=A0AAV1WKQ4_LUPLU
MPQLDSETLVSVFAGSSINRKIACETLSDDHESEIHPHSPPESIWLSRDEEFDWLDRNAVCERKESTKGNSNSDPNYTNLNPNPNSQSNSRRFSSKFNLADDILRILNFLILLRLLSLLLWVPGLVNVDFADVRAIMANAGSSLMGIGTATAEVIYDLVDPTANLIFGAVIDPSLSGQVSITLIATGFKRQEEREGRPTQASQLMQVDPVSFNRRPSSFTDGGFVEIPDFLKKKGRSRYPRA